MQKKSTEKNSLTWHAEFTNPHRDITEKESKNITRFLQDVFDGKLQLSELSESEEK